MKTTEVYTFADIHNIMLVEFDMCDTKSLSCQTLKGDCHIAVDYAQLENSSEEKVLLAHEIGHCVTGAFYNRENILDVRGRHEYRANRWAVKKLIPWQQLQEVLDIGIIEPWELAEYFEVTEDFMHTALKIYRCQGKL